MAALMRSNLRGLRELMIPKSTSFSILFRLGVGVIAVGLGMLDMALAFQRMGKFDRLRMVLRLFTVASAVLMIVCLWSVSRVDQAMRILLADSLAGVDASLKMGSVITETQASLVEIQPGGEIRLPESVLRRFNDKFEMALKRYQEGVILSDEKTMVNAITHSAGDYMEALERLVNGESQPGDWRQAFGLGTELRLNVRRGATFNAESIDHLAKNARASTMQVYVTFGILGGAWIVSSVLALSVLGIAKLVNESKE